MDKQTITFSNPDGKKHSVRYKAQDSDAAISDVYIRRTAFGDGAIPKTVKITLEEV